MFTSHKITHEMLWLQLMIIIIHDLYLMQIPGMLLQCSTIIHRVFKVSVPLYTVLTLLSSPS